MKIPIRIILEDGVQMPQYESKDSAGFDIRANNSGIIKAGQKVLVPTGIKMAIPEGFELQLRPRSGLSWKTDLKIPNSPATIDADYRGEIKIILENTGVNDFHYEKGDRLCQGVLKQAPQAVFFAVDTLDDTERGEGGFGHTGK